MIRLDDARNALIEFAQVEIESRASGRVAS